MGDMADYYDDRYEDLDEDFDENGEDYFTIGRTYNGKVNKRRPRICNYCGEEGLIWTKHNGGWRLMDPNLEELHNCKARKWRWKT